jgi:hypothetical protein
VKPDFLEEAHRLLGEGRLTVFAVSESGAQATVREDDAVYSLGRHRGGWRCDCRAEGWCSHLAALALVVGRPAPDPPVAGRSTPGSVAAVITEGCTCESPANDLGHGFENVTAVERRENPDEDGGIILERGWRIDPACPVHADKAAGR